MIYTNKKTRRPQALLTIIFALLTVCFIWQIAPGPIYSSSANMANMPAQCRFDGTQPLPEPEPEAYSEAFALVRHTDHKEVIIIAPETQPEPEIEVTTEPAIEPKPDIRQVAEAATEKITEITTEITTEKITETPTKKITEIIIEPTAKVSPSGSEHNGIKEGDIITGATTHYCACNICNGNFKGITSSGYKIEHGVQSYTVGCNWLPLGAVIEVSGVQYTIRDRGGKWLSNTGNIDIFVPEGHAEALNKGRLSNIEIKIIYLP